MSPKHNASYTATSSFSTSGSVSAPPLMRRLSAAADCSSAEFSAAAFFFSLHFSPNSVSAAIGSLPISVAQAPPLPICFMIVASASASGRLCAPCVAGVTISSSTNWKTTTAASQALAPALTDPSPLHAHAADCESHCMFVSQAPPVPLLSFKTCSKAVAHGMTYPASTNVFTVAIEFWSRRSFACLLSTRASRNRELPTSPSSADATASINTVLANNSHRVRALTAPTGRASIALTRQSATSPQVPFSPSANDGNQRRKRANSLVTSSGNNRRTRIETSSGIGTAGTSLGGATFSSKCAC